MVKHRGSENKTITLDLTLRATRLEYIPRLENWHWQDLLITHSLQLPTCCLSQKTAPSYAHKAIQAIRVLRSCLICSAMRGLGRRAPGKTQLARKYLVMLGILFMCYEFHLPKQGSISGLRCCSCVLTGMACSWRMYDGICRFEGMTCNKRYIWRMRVLLRFLGCTFTQPMLHVVWTTLHVVNNEIRNWVVMS